MVLNLTYSDAGMMIEREGVLYSEAVDPADENRVYTETEKPILSVYGLASDAAREADYQNALRSLGVSL